MGRGGHTALSATAHRAAHDERLVGGVAAFLLVVGLAADNGGFDAVSWDRALLGIALLAAVVAARANVVALLLAGLTAWTALSYLWSESPASALAEAQRVALYAVAAAAIRARSWSIVAGATVVALWNLVTRLHGVGHATGAGAEPVGYANGLALLCVLGLVLLPSLGREWWPTAIPLAAVLVLQHSAGAYAALVVGVAMYVVRRGRVAVVATAVAALLAAPFVVGSNERSHYWPVAAREWTAHPVLGSGAGTYVNWWTRERDQPVQTLEAHSLYVETLAELGPLGLVLVVALLAWPLARARRPELAAGIAAYAVGAAVDFDWELAGVTLPAILVAAAAVPQGRRVSRFVLAPVAVAALLAYLGNAKLSSAQDAARRGDVQTAVADARAALRWQPYAPEPWLVLGDVTHDAAAYRQAVQLDPANWLLWQRLASVEHGQPRRLAEAKAAQLNPLGH